MQNFLCAFCFLSLFVCAYDSRQIDGRIVGGEAARFQQFLYQVALFINVAETGETTFCGGSLISSNYVLTVAHCVVIADEVTVVLGALEIDASEPWQVRMTSREFTAHENYQDVSRWDIALIKLPEPVEFSDYIQPIQLADGDDRYVGEVGLVTGWGPVTQAEGSFESHLRYTENTILSNHQCKREAPEYISVVKNSHICVSRTGFRGSCVGDSGGPLVVDDVQIGIVSFGYGNCFDDEIPAVYTRITSYRDWIREHSDV